MTVTAVSWFLIGFFHLTDFGPIVERMTSKGECHGVIAALREVGANTDRLKCVEITVTEHIGVAE